jgi:hypothetical protein
MDKYMTVNDDWVDLQKRASNADPDAMAEMTVNGKTWKKKVTKAENDLITLGSKIAFEKIFAELSQLEGTNIVLLKKKYKEEFDFLKKTSLEGADYYYSAPIPATTLKNKEQWINFTFNKSSYDSSSSNTSHTWAAGATYAGLVSVAGNGTHTNQNSNYNFEDLEISFKLGKVAISRPWLNRSFIKSGYWRMTKDGERVMTDPKSNKVIPISDGNGVGMMPAICTELYFVTDLKIGFKKGSDSYNRTQNEINAGAHLAIGPFLFGGRYGYKDERVTMTGKREEQGISSPGILLIGRKFNIVDLAPNPLSTIKEGEWI